jgi:type IV pilus assembly protein PilE
MSLIELLTVVVIVGILAGIAIPAYRSYVVRANRTDAKTALMFYAGALERCYTRYNSYAYNSNAALGCTVNFPQTSENGHYQITASTRTADTYTLTATPQGPQAKDTKCGNFTLDNVNKRDSSVTGAAATCWGK